MRQLYSVFDTLEPMEKQSVQKVAKDDLPALVARVLEKLPTKETRNKAALITLSGELGAGKTTFTQALARALGVADTVVSPTYVLMKSYALSGQPFEKLVHIDAYRLSDAAEFAALEPAEFLLDPGALVVVEWPERIEGALPAPDVALKLSSQDASSEERYIQFD